MEFNRIYNRQEFINFLQNSFLPEDFISYRAQNETYMCRSAENVVKCLCFNKLCAVG